MYSILYKVCTLYYTRYVLYTIQGMYCIQYKVCTLLAMCPIPRYNTRYILYQLYVLYEPVCYVTHELKKKELKKSRMFDYIINQKHT